MEPTSQARLWKAASLLMQSVLQKVDSSLREVVSQLAVASRPILTQPLADQTSVSVAKTHFLEEILKRYRLGLVRKR